jgi:O-antigen/teichoic acid export membrane protein
MNDRVSSARGLARMAGQGLSAFLGPGTRRRYLMIAAAENFALVLLLVQAIVLARVLGPEQLGVYSLALAHLTLVGQMVCLGIPQSYTFHARRDLAHAQTYFNAALVLLMGSSVVMSVATAWLVPRLSPELPRSAIALIVLAAYVPIVALRPLFRNALNIAGAYGRLAAIPILAGIVQVALVVLLAGAGRLTAWAALVAFIGAAAVRSLVSIPAAMAGLRRRPAGKTVRPYRDIARTSPMYLFVTFALVAYGQAPIVILGAFGGEAAELGYLSRAVQLAGLVPLAMQGIMPLLFNHWAGRRPGDIQKNVRECMIIAACLIVPVTGLIILFGHQVLELLFGADFRPAYPALVILQFMALPLVLMNLLTQAMGSQAAQQWTIAAYGGAATVLLGVVAMATAMTGQPNAAIVAAGALAGSLVGASILIVGLWRRRT